MAQTLDSDHFPVQQKHNRSTSVTLSPRGPSVLSSPMRPTSSYTNDSTFADSAVDMDATVSSEALNRLTHSGTDLSHAPMRPITPLEIDQTLSDKMRQLAAVAFTMEQDDNMPHTKRAKLLHMMNAVERFLDLDVQDEPHADQLALKTQPGKSDEGSQEDEWIDEAELISVRDSLANTVKSMRQRHEEQRHLHQLMAHKLEVVAQRCLLQEQQAEDLLRDLRQLRLDNHSLTSDNQVLKERVACLEVDASRNEVAVEAMSSAVTGLEGWIEATQQSPSTPVPEPKSRRAKVVIRGKGRFRGRYYVDEDGDQAVAYSLADAATDSQELHDGVKAWLRGFRDVEEELRHHDPPHSSTRANQMSHLTSRQADRRVEDDWGDFESPPMHANE